MDFELDLKMLLAEENSSAPTKFIRENWRDFKGKSFSRKCETFVEGEGLVETVEVITLTGIGKQAFQYTINGDDKKYYARYDNRDANWLAGRILTSPEAGESPFWNRKVNLKILYQRMYCRTHRLPNFAPNDGFCWSCGEQIYTKISRQEAQTDLITGCPHCHKSFCD